MNPFLGNVGCMELQGYSLLEILENSHSTENVKNIKIGMGRFDTSCGFIIFVFSMIFDLWVRLLL